MKKRKTKIVNCLKLVILLIGVSALLWNCEKEIDHIAPEVHLQNDQPKIQFLDLTKAKKIPDFIEISDEFETSHLFDKDINKNDLRSKSSSAPEFTIDFNEIRRIEYKDLISYTFLIKRKSVNEKYLTENLVIEKRDNNVRGYIVKYREASHFEKNGHKYLRAKVSKTPYKKNLTDILKKVNVNLQGKTSCKYEMTVTPRDCSEHGTFSSNPKCINAQTGNYYDVTVSLVCTDSGHGGGDGFSDFDGSDDTSEGGGGGGTNSGGGATSPIIPCEDEIHGCDKTPHLKLAYDLGINNLNQINYLEDNPTVVDDINTFLQTNNNSYEAKNFAKSAIEILSDPLLPPNQTVVGYTAKIQKLINHLKQFGNPEDEFFAEYIESLIPDFNSMTVGDVYEIYKLAKQQSDNLIYKYLDAIVVPFAEAAYPFIIYALTEATLGAALPLLSRIPLGMVTRGARLNKMVKQVGLLGVQGSNNTIRIVTTKGNTYTKSLELFVSLTRNAQSITTHANGTRVALFNNGNKIVFRTQSSSGFLATLELTFPKIWSKPRIVKFK